MSKQIYLKGQYSSSMDYRKYIDVSPNNRVARSFLKGTCISVNDVLSWLSLQVGGDKIIAEYPNLTIGSIRACLAYAAENEEVLRSAS